MVKSPTEEVFTQIYKTGGWRSRESASGPGSTVKVTETVRRLIPELITRYNVRTLLDIPCGDFNWMKEVDLSGIRYIGADLVADLISENERNYPVSNICFTQLDLIRDALPKADLILTRDCLVHLSFKDCAAALNNIKKSNSAWLLTTIFPSVEINRDIKTGEFRKINLCREPFNFPTPQEIYSESHDIETNPNKCLGLWRIQDLLSYS